jgi:hypothetical protein
VHVVVALLRPYDVVHTAPGTFVTEFFFTRESFRFSGLPFGLPNTIDTENDKPVGIFLCSGLVARWTSVALPRPRLVLAVSLGHLYVKWSHANM